MTNGPNADSRTGFDPSCCNGATMRIVKMSFVPIP